MWLMIVAALIPLAGITIHIFGWYVCNSESNAGKHPLENVDARYIHNFWRTFFGLPPSTFVKRPDPNGPTGATRVVVYKPTNQE